MVNVGIVTLEKYNELLEKHKQTGIHTSASPSWAVLNKCCIETLFSK